MADELQKMRLRAERALTRLTKRRRDQGLPVDDLPPLDDWEATVARQNADARVAEREEYVARLRAEVEARRRADQSAPDPASSDTKRKRRKRKEREPAPKGAAVTAASRRYAGLELVYSDGRRTPVDPRDPRTIGPNDIGRDVPVDERGHPQV